MALGFDPSVLLSARGVNLPDPMALAQRQMTLGALADQRRLREEQAAAQARAAAEAEALRASLPGVVRGGFSDESIAGADPRAIPALLKQADAYRKTKAETAKDEADAESKRSGTKLKVAEHLANEAMWLADHPNLSPEMIANFQKKVAGVGAQDVLTNVPFQDWANPDKARDALRSTGNMFYAVKDRVSQAETGRHNRATEGNTVRGQDLTAETARRGQNMTDARARDANRVAQGQADALMQGQPQEINVDGKPVLAIYDRRTATFYDANTRQPIRQGIGPKEPDLPATLREKLAQNEVTISKIGRALQLVDQTPGSFGLQNALGDTVMQRADPGGVEVRALVSDIAGQRIHDRSGAAVTVGEMARLKPYIPNVTDTPETVKRKLALLETEYQKVQSEIAQGRSLADMIRARAAERGETSAGGQKEFKSMPDPASLSGKRIQAPDGTIYKSDGTRWVRQ